MPPVVPLPSGFLSRPIAHRGLHDILAGRPENSLAAARAACDAGYALEIDVRRAADGVAMVFHDATLTRMTRTRGRLANLGSAALRRLPLAGSAERIPTLEELLHHLGPDTPVLIEMKPASPRLSGADDGLAEAVAEAIAGHAGPLAVMSFDPGPVAQMAALRPDIARGLVTCRFPMREWPHVPRARRARLAAIADYDAVGASFISHDARRLKMARVAALKAEGAAVLCWTIRSPGDERAARRIADGITFEGYLPALPET